VRLRGVTTVAATAFALLIGIAAFQTGALGQLERETLDGRFARRQAAAPAGVAVVAVDEKTFSDLRAQWPFRRRLHAQLIDRLREDGAKVVVYDVQFTEPTDAADDMTLYRAVGRDGHVVLATTEVDSGGHTDVLGGDANLRTVGAVAAASNLPSEQGGVIRRYPDTLLGLPSLAAAAARADGHPLSPRRFSSGTAWIDFRGPAGTIHTYSFSDVLRRKVDPRLLAGRVVVVGAAAPTLQDVHPTPTSASHLMSGPEIQANAIWTALHDNPLRSAPEWATLLTILLGALLAPLTALGGRLLLATVFDVGIAALYLLGAQLAFDRGLVLPVAYPLLTLLAGSVATVGTAYAKTFVERNRFSRQLAASQVELIQRLAQAVEQRDAETGAHVRRIGLMCERLALAVGWSERDARMLRHASAMHDIGKVGIPDAVLLKPGALDPDEWDVIRSHTKRGAEILAGSASPLVQLAESVALHHHERWDGSGYPHGLSGEQIPEGARICAVCDVFDALLSTRPYKFSWGVEQALVEIERCRGSDFDPRLVDAFIAIVPGLIETLEHAEAPAELRARPVGAFPNAPAAAGSPRA
jgi:CHASE2 domain-containing sensor protein